MRTAGYARIAWLCFCLIAVASAARAAAPSDVPEFTGLIVDQVGALTEPEFDALLKRLGAIQNSERAQAAILISKDTDGAPLSDYALRVAETWKLGRAGRDDGLLIVIVPSPAGARIEVGYGLEGVIPDARASQWLDDLLPAIRDNQIAQGLNRLLDRIESVLPAAATPEPREPFLLDAHPEYKAPFVLVVFSLFAIFPLFFGRWGSIASAFLLAAFWGGAAWSMWEASAATYAVAGGAFVLPLMWGLNWSDDYDRAPWLSYLKALGNAIGVAVFFVIITLFVGVGLSAAEESIWGAPVFAGLLALGLAACLFPGTPAHYLMIVLRSAMHFIFVLVVAYVGLAPFIPDPSRIALIAASMVTACAALGLYLDSRERATGHAAGLRWSVALFGLAALVALPFAILAFYLAIGGEDIRTQLTQAAAGGGTIAALIALAARLGLVAAVKIGLGGRFGGGGAGRSD